MDKEKIKNIIIFVGVLLCITFFIYCLNIIFKANLTRYVYLKNDKMGISKECYKDNNVNYCKIDNYFIYVERFNIIENEK